jgi:aldehyde dehydrogenase
MALLTATTIEPGKFGTPVAFKKRYGNFIGGEWVKPAKGEYFDNITPITGKAFCEIPRSTAEDVERALDAGHAEKTKWGRLSPAERSLALNKIADRIEAKRRH